MLNKRMFLLALMGLLAVLSSPAADVAWADDDNDHDNRGREMTIAGFVDVPGTAGLQLPLAAGAAPVVINMTLGVPSVTIPIQVTPDTRVKPASAAPLTLVDGDRIKVDAHVVGNALRADRIELEAFPEVELIGTAKGLPAAGITLPLAAGTTQNFVITLGASNVDVPVQLTSKTKIRGHLTSLHNGDAIQLEAGVRNNVIVITEINHAPGEPS
jgi:hypothetical protein